MKHNFTKYIFFTCLSWLLFPVCLVGQTERLTVLCVQSVYDGDTFTADLACEPSFFCQRVRIRLCGVDTPEMNSHDDKERKLAQKSKIFTANHLLAAKEIVLTDLGKDKYCRTLAKVWVDGEDLGALLLRNQLAEIYPRGANTYTCKTYR